MSDKEKQLVGLYEKFHVERTDGRSAEGQKHHGCEYFVLDLDHDPYAHAAIIAYAKHCADKYPELASDLFAKARKMAMWMVEDQFAKMPESERQAWARMVHNDPERR